MKQTAIRLGILSILILCLASCNKKVADQVTTDTNTPQAELESIVQKVNQTRTNLTQVAGHVTMELTMDKQSVKVSGDIKMKRNNIIQVTLQALGLVTIGRMEFTPEDMMIMDNINKRYVKLPYEKITFFKENGIDYYTFQSLFWNELFLPGSKDAVPAAASFTSERQGKNVILKHQAKNLLLTFLTNPANGQLTQSQVKGRDNDGMVCDYLSWTNIKNETFPNKLLIKLALEPKSASANLEFSKLRVDDSWKGNTTKIDTKKYKELTMQQVMNAIMSLSK